VIFRNLSVNSENKVLVVQGDAVPGLLALLRTPQDPTAVEGDPEYEAQVHKPKTLNPKPYTLNPKPKTINPQP